MDQIRTFIAIELDAPTKAYIQAHQHALAEGLPRTRFVAPATWHITLAFIGDIDAAQLHSTEEATREAAMQSMPFTVQTTHIGIFGPPSAPRVIWIGLGGMRASLERLHLGLIAALQARGLPCDAKQFAPHITLARSRLTLTTDESAFLESQQTNKDIGPLMPVTMISIMRSDLTPQGAHYTRLRAVPLGPTETA